MIMDRKQMRMKGRDYSLRGDYFITIVTQDRICRFGEIVNGEMQLSGSGIMVRDCYESLQNTFGDVCCLDYVIMPNHIHFILRLLSDNNSLYEIIRQFKSRTTVEYIKGVNQKGWPRFDLRLWQKGYFDHIIRNQRAFDYIRNYIFVNPSRWVNDRINPQCCSNSDDINGTIKSLY